MKQTVPFKLSEIGILFWMGNVLITIVVVHLLRSDFFSPSNQFLDIASTVLFDVFIKAEWLVMLLLFFTFFIIREAGKHTKRMYGLAVFIVIAQAVWLLPSINANSKAGLDSVLFFVTLESAKIILLALIGNKLISGKKKHAK
ncbi:MAG: hypothetical protein KBF73_12545 [Flavobacteriales bacterium]|nr:hypothetical protein [Flavobacteriales bacterium]